MQYFTHSIYGIALFLGAIQLVQTTILDKILLLILSLVGSLLPDIDSPKSKIGKYFFFLNFAATHRGVLHSITGIILISAMSYLMLPMLFALIFTFAFISHILLDALNKKGIRPLYPLKWKIKGPVKIGSLWELLIASIGVIICLALI